MTTRASRMSPRILVAIGAFLMIGAMTVFMQSRTTFRITESVSRLQETARFAIDSLEPDIRMAQSMMDYIFRRLALDYLPYSDRSALGILTAEERVGQLNGTYGGDEVDVEAMRSTAPVEAGAKASQPNVTAGPAETTPRATLEFTPQTDLDAPLCFTCGVKMRRAGSCYVCESCGSTSGCS